MSAAPERSAQTYRAARSVNSLAEKKRFHLSLLQIVAEDENDLVMLEGFEHLADRV